ncbi:hypothetical protein RIF29_24968 [Crotalaria pallida]|uniref:Uncharacterized protein n=1 Tax=Crotalaria pallida TaxID=3830 RepID=A0AAN9I3R4_CROPI
MVAKKHEVGNPKKRKRIGDSNNNTESANESHPKKPFNSAKKPFKSVNNKKPFKFDNKKPFKSDKPNADGKDKKSAAPASGRERRLYAKVYRIREVSTPLRLEKADFIFLSISINILGFLLLPPLRASPRLFRRRS